MKPIDQMNAGELAEYIDTHFQPLWPNECKKAIKRLRAIHDLTRWIPVSERMPTEEDGFVSWYIDKGKGGGTMNKKWNNVPRFVTHWQRITPPTKE